MEWKSKQSELICANWKTKKLSVYLLNNNNYVIIKRTQEECFLPAFFHPFPSKHWPPNMFVLLFFCRRIYNMLSPVAEPCGTRDSWLTNDQWLEVFNFFTLLYLFTHSSGEECKKRTHEIGERERETEREKDTDRDEGIRGERERRIKRKGERAG